MIDWPGGRARPWITYPGLFADGELDAGTRLLLVSLEQLPNPGRVLDYGCGTGVIARAVLDANPTSEVEAMDIDVLALAALVENAPTAKPLLGDRLPANTTWNRIVSNPPIHVGVREDHTALTRLIETAPTHLTKGGDFVVVVQRRLPLDTQLAASFSKVEILADDGRYRVWRATH
jgi:16S rRNA (guanine1207-N2)-methyltransferase